MIGERFMNSATSGPDSAPPLSAGAGRYRWVICGLLFAATAVNYIDRQMIGVLKPTLQAEFGWNENAYSTIILWFQLAYALGYLSFGKIVDQIGARGLCHRHRDLDDRPCGAWFCGGVASFAAARFGLGVGDRAISPPVSAPWPTGSRKGSGHWPSASSTRARMWGRSSPRCWSRLWCCGSDGGRRSLSPASLAWPGWRRGGRSIAIPRCTRM
jgi:MFS family permease